MIKCCHQLPGFGTDMSTIVCCLGQELFDTFGFTVMITEQIQTGDHMVHVFCTRCTCFAPSACILHTVHVFCTRQTQKLLLLPLLNCTKELNGCISWSITENNLYAWGKTSSRLTNGIKDITRWQIIIYIPECLVLWTLTRNKIISILPDKQKSC